MKQTFKRLTALILALSMCLSLLCSTAWAADMTETDGNAVEAVVTEEAAQPEASGEALKGAASGTCGKNLTWTLDDAGTLTISGTGAMTNWEWGDYAPWYDYCSQIKAITIGNGVTSIGDMAFYDCNSLTSITIPDSVTSIGEDAFSGCSSLTSVTIPNSVTSIGDSAFSGCESLSIITIPNSVTSIGDDAFRYCSSLTKVTIPNSVTSIGESAFSGCSSLTSITVNANNPVYSSADGVLFTKNKKKLLYCPGGRKGAYSIPSSVTSIGTGAFYLCESLTSVTIPNSVTSIGAISFCGCTSLTSVTIPNSVTSIGEYAFSGCSSLTSVTIPNSVTSIGDGAFYDCSSLTKVTIGSGVTSIGEDVFSDCTSLSSITVNTNNSVYSSADGVLLTKNKKKLLYCPKGKKGAYSIPSSVTSIGEYVFLGCTSLTSVTIPSSVTSIGEGAFWGCHGLTSMTIPNSVTSIGECAFDYCSKLTSVIIPKSVTSIGSGAFFACESLTHVYYVGTKEQWKKIKIGSNNDGLEYATIHYNYTPNLKSNNITASSFTKTYSTKEQSFSIGASCKGGAKLTYSSSSSKVKVSSAGKVTIPAKFMGKVTITITSAATGTYTKTTKKITVTVNPTKTTLSSVTNAKGLKMTVKWAKNTVGTGYEIQYSTKKDFSSGNKSTTVSKNTTVSKTITGLTKGKTYYVRIRTYKTVSSVKYYSGWSAVKSVKISK